MAFKTDGSSHNNGVKLEEKLASSINSNKDLQRAIGGDENLIKAEQIGGTKRLEDIVAHYPSGPQGLSVKRREKVSGTFDFLNSTASVKKSLREDSRLLSKVKELNGKYKGIPKDESIKKSYAKIIDDLCSKEIEQLSSSSIRNIIFQIVKKYQHLNMKMYIYRLYSNEHIIYDFNDIWWTKLLNQEGEFFLKRSSRSKKSATVWYRTSSGEEVNTYLRIRIGLNNGVGALLGGKEWSSNASSSVVIKVQQDNTKSIVPPSANIVKLAV